MIALKAVGKAEIRTDKATITPAQDVLFSAGLYLLLECGKPVSRRKLASMLWPSATSPVAAHRLRQTILQLRKNGFRITSDSTTVTVPSADVALNFRDEAKRSCHEDSLEFLQGHSFACSDSFQEWADGQRQRAQSEVVETLVESLLGARSQGDWPTCEREALKVLALDPYNETAVLARAEAVALRGSKRSALEILDDYINDVGPCADVKIPARVLRNRITRRAEARIAGNRRNSAFVGRRTEFETLVAAVESATRGKGSAWLVSGEAGIGKTRLISEVQQFAELQGYSIHRASCRRGDATQPLSVFLELVPALKNLRGALGCSANTLACLKALTDWDGTSSSASGTHEGSPAYVRNAILDLVDAVNEENALLLVIEDVQWLDHVSAAMIQSLIDRTRTTRLLLLFSTRDQTSFLKQVGADTSVETIALGPLADDAALRFVERIVAQSNLDTIDDIGWLIRRGGGNPFLLQELSTYWLETGRKDGIPASVSRVVSERIGSLKPLPRRLVQTCAVLGENATLDRIEKVLGCPGHELLDAIEDVTLAGMLDCAAPVPPGLRTVRTRHDLIATAALNDLAPLALEFLHRRCGQVLEDELKSSESSIKLLRACATHWKDSGDVSHARRLAIQCADHLLEIGLAADAASAYESALTYSNTDERRDLLHRLARARFHAKEWCLLLEAIQKLRELTIPSNAPIHDDLELMELDALRRSGASLIELFNRALSCVYNEELPPPHRVESATRALKVATLLAAIDEMPRIHAAISPLLNDPTVSRSAAAEANLVFHTMCGDLGEAKELAQALVTDARVDRTAGRIVTALLNLSFVLNRTGPTSEIMNVMKEAYDVAVQYKSWANAREVATRVLPHLVGAKGETYVEWQERASRPKNIPLDVDITFNLAVYQARLYLEKDDFSEARRAIAPSLSSQWLHERRGWYAAALAIDLRGLIGAFRPTDEISETVSVMEALFEDTSRLGGQDYEVASLCLGLCHLGRRADAVRYLNAYLTYNRRENLPLLKELIRVKDLLRPDENFHS